MMKIVAMTAILSTLLLVVSCTNDTSNYDAGIEAYKRKHYEVALYDFEKWANQGDSKAQFCLGYMYKYGEGVKPDDEEAMAWYTKAAQNGYAPAQNNLAKMYNDGWLNSKGKREGPYLKKAVELWEQAAEKDSSNAQANLGFVYFAMAYPAESLNLEKDKELLYLKKAEELLKKAEEQELPQASVLLGTLYLEKGREAADNEDFKSGHEWYKMAEKSYKACSGQRLCESAKRSCINVLQRQGSSAVPHPRREMERSLEMVHRSSRKARACCLTTISCLHVLSWRGGNAGLQKSRGIMAKGSRPRQCHCTESSSQYVF